MTNPKHTDTSRSGDLVKRLRDNFDLTECEHGFRLGGGHTCPNEDCDRRDIREAADRIEALEAALEQRERETVAKIVAWLRGVSDPGATFQDRRLAYQLAAVNFADAIEAGEWKQ